MSTLQEQIAQTYGSGTENTNKVGTFESVLSGIGSGLIGIPKGLFSLGATLMDLGVNSGKAAKVEQWFDDLTDWDEKAEATTAGKLTEVLVNIGVPGGLAFRHGTKMANLAMQASKNGKYLDLNNPILKKGLKDTYKLTKKGKTKEFMTGALLGGAAEGVFVGDVQDVGSLGDLLGGPTEIDRTEGTDAVRDLLNRIKFGTEGAMFTGLIGGTGATIRKLRNRNNELDIANSKLDRWIDKVGSWFRSRSGWTPEAFAEFRKSKGLAGGDARFAKTMSRDIDKSIDAMYPKMKSIMDNSPTSKARNEFMSDVQDALMSGEARISDELIDARGLKAGQPGFDKATARTGRVDWGPMEKDKLEKVVRKMDELLPKDKAAKAIADLTGNLSAIRTKWGGLFDELGKSLTPDEIKEFKLLFGQKFKDYLGNTYEFMYRDSLIPWFRYKPTQELIDRAKEVFMDSAREAKRKVLPEEAEAMVSNVIRSARMPKGFRMDRPSDAIFNIPDFFVNRAILSETTEKAGKEVGKTLRGSQMINIAQLEPKTRKVFEDLLGKQANPMQTILAGTAKLSMIVRRNVFFKDLMKKNDELIRAGKTPMFVRSEDEALRLYGDNYKRIAPLDPTESLHVGTKARQSYVKKLKDKGQQPKITAEGMTNPFSDPNAPFFSTPGMADALEQVGTKIADRQMIGQLYHSLLLYPKATSQIAKTILSPVTHMRNFISAAAFASANGIVPFSDKEAIKMAYSALQTPLKGTGLNNKLYDRLLELGVVNTNVRLGDVSKLLEDVKFGETMTANMGGSLLMKQLSKIKSVGQDLYTAEDDFWKIYSWAVEKKRMESAFRSIGLTKNQNQTFKNAAGETINLTEDWLEREAADIVKNNIPNYDFVSDFVKGTRKLPLGNFVSFPAEIARTGTNIVERALRDINFEVIVNGKKVKPFEALGYQRLLGFGATVAAIPYATTEMFKVLYDVTDEEQAAIRRYVADWSKNSTILPIKDEKGEFKYVDFSHANAYDTLLRPVQTVINSVADGRKDNDGIMDDFMLGTFTSMKEFASPFISESIWTEAASDIIMRGGRTRDGFEVYNEKDNWGNKTKAIFKHLVEAQMPFPYPQLKRLDRSLKPVDVLTKGKYDDYGQDYEFGDEFAGLFGFRAVQVNPGRTMKYKVANYKNGVRKSGSLFTRVTLKGGPIEPREIVDAYINANRSLFKVKKDLKLDMDAARILGISDEKYDQALGGVSNVEQSAIDDGEFRPYSISPNIEEAFQLHADEMGVANPLDAAYDIISNLEDEFSDLTLDGLFPSIENPLTPSIMDMGPIPGLNTGTPLPFSPGVSPQAVTNQGGNMNYNQMTTQQKIDILFGRN